MTPTNSREVALSLSRDRLARATARLERLSRDAVETINSLRAEKRELEQQLLNAEQAAGAERSELEARLADLTRMFEQERTNFEQRAMLLTSVSAELEDRTRAFDELALLRDDQERILNAQLVRIDELEAKLAGQAMQMEERSVGDQSTKSEIEALEARLGESEARVESLTQERDGFRSELYEHERQEAQWALKLSPTEKATAAKAIDGLLSQLAEIEARMTVQTNGSATSHAAKHATKEAH